MPWVSRTDRLNAKGGPGPQPGPCSWASRRLTPAGCREGPIPGLAYTVSRPATPTRRREDSRPEKAEASRGEGWENGVRQNLRVNGAHNGSTGPEGRPGPVDSRLREAKAATVRPPSLLSAAPPPLPARSAATHGVLSQGNGGPEADQSWAASASPRWRKRTRPPQRRSAARRQPL